MRKGLVITYFVLCFMLFGTVESLAYLDPSTTTYVIQIVAGGLIAAGTAIGIYWHKIKKAVTGKKSDTRINKSENNQTAAEGKTLTAEEILAMAEDKKENN